MRLFAVFMIIVALKISGKIIKQATIHNKGDGKLVGVSPNKPWIVKSLWSANVEKTKNIKDRDDAGIFFRKKNSVVREKLDDEVYRTTGFIREKDVPEKLNDEMFIKDFITEEVDVPEKLDDEMYIKDFITEEDVPEKLDDEMYIKDFIKEEEFPKKLDDDMHRATDIISAIISPKAKAETTYGSYDEIFAMHQKFANSKVKDKYQHSVFMDFMTEYTVNRLKDVLYIQELCYKFYIKNNITMPKPIKYDKSRGKEYKKPTAGRITSRLVKKPKLQEESYILIYNNKPILELTMKTGAKSTEEPKVFKVMMNKNSTEKVNTNVKKPNCFSYEKNQECDKKTVPIVGNVFFSALFAFAYIIHKMYYTRAVNERQQTEI